MVKVLPKSPQNDEEFKQRTLEMLEELGVESPSVGETGSIPVSTPSISETKIDNINKRETTSFAQETINRLPRPASEKAVFSPYDRPICRFLDCGVLQYFQLECKGEEIEFKPPEISVENVPGQVQNVTAYLNLGNPRIEGEFQISGENFSTPGKEIIKTVYKCSSKQKTERNIIDGSGVVGMEASHGVIENSTDAALDTIESTIPEVQPNATRTTTATFSKSGGLNVLEGLLSAFTTGTIRANVDATIDVSYEFRDSIRTRSFQYDSSMRIPVDTDSLNYNIGLF
jgi:hypothetical protein